MQNQKQKKVTIIGAGAWGLSIANHSASLGNETYLFCRNKTYADIIASKNSHPKYLPEYKIAKNIKILSEISDIDIKTPIILAVPGKETVNILNSLKDNNDIAHFNAMDILLTSKGMHESGCFPFEIASQILLSKKISLLSGPSFAIDLIRGMPIAVVISSEEINNVQIWLDLLHGKNLRIYPSNKMLTVAFGGVTKNVIAVASGIVDGANFGDSAKAGLITRGFAEIYRLGERMKLDPTTLRGLSGLGDLILTCNSPKSRNFSFGFDLGRGLSVKEAKENAKGVIEALSSVSKLAELGKKYDVELPITNAINNIIEETISLDETLKGFFERPIKIED